MNTRARARAGSPAASVSAVSGVSVASSSVSSDNLASSSSTSSSSVVNSHSFFAPTKQNFVRLAQRHNMAVAAMVTIGYLARPDASFLEYGADVAIHVLSALISENVGSMLPKVGIAANTFRLLDIAKNVYSGTSTIPFFLNVADVANHVVNIAAEATAYTMSMGKK